MLNDHSPKTSMILESKISFLLTFLVFPIAQYLHYFYSQSLAINLMLGWPPTRASRMQPGSFPEPGYFRAIVNLRTVSFIVTST